MKRDKLFTIRMNDDDRALAARIAKHTGVTFTVWVRVKMKEEERKMKAQCP